MNTSRRFLAVFLAFGFVILAGTLYYARTQAAAQDAQMHQAKVFAVGESAQELERDLQDVVKDLRFLTDHPALARALDGTPGSAGPLTDNFVAFATAHELYNQIRWLDETGRERLRVDFDAGKTVVVPADRLQDKHDRPYFTATMGLPAGGFYVSPFDLNVEHGRVEVPFRPTLRVATPVFDAAGIRRGIVIVNLVGQHLLDNFVESVGNHGGHTMLLNGAGYWLKSSEPADEWGFMFKRAHTLGTRFPAAWARIVEQDAGQFEDASGLWTWDTIHPLSAAGIQADEMLAASAEVWKAVDHVPAEELATAHAALWKPTLAAALAMFVLLAVGGWRVALGLKRQHAAEAAILQAESEKEAARLRFEENFRNVVLRAPIGMALVRERRIVLMNRVCLDYFGYAEGDMPSLDECWQRIYPDPAYRQEVADGWSAADAAAREGIEIARGERRVCCADGRVHDMEISRVNLDSGVLVTLIDVTERRQHAEQLAELAAFNATVIDKSTQGIVAYRPSGECIMANEAAARILGCTVAQIREQNFRVNPAWEKCGLLNMAITALDTGAPQRLEHQTTTPFGKTGWFCCELVPFMSAGDRHLLLVIVDITPFREAERTLRETSEAKSAFLANMSHEIRTPMNAILGLAQILEGAALPAEERGLVKKIRSAGRSLLGIINDILDFSKIESGRLEIEHTPFRLDAVLENLSTIMGANVGAKPIELLIRQPPAFCGRLIGDPLRLEQILINLTSNAIKFTAHGEVGVAVELLDQSERTVRLRFAVRDTGIGIAADELGHIFQAFVQADASTTRHFGGTGLGLSICKRLVELMGGTIGVTSEPGQGSEFWFDLPFAVDRTAAPVSSSERLNLLITDDHQGTREVLATLANSLGWQADTASSGAEAIAKTRARQEHSAAYDIVVMDWQMPHLDGLAASRAIRAESGDAQPPIVIMVTGYGRNELLQIADANLADVVLSKPVTASMMHDAVVEAIAKRSGTLPLPANGAAGGPRLGGVELLVVDDSLLNQEVAQRVLEREGARVTLANDGQEALDCLRRQPFDCVLMDVQMPVMDGLTATRAIRQELRLPELPVIALTAGVLGEQRDQVFAAGMNDFIAKPFEFEPMIATLRRWVRPNLRNPPATAAPRASSVTTDDPDDLPAIAGIDTTLVLSRLGRGSRRFFLSLLRQLDEEFAETEALTRADLDRGDAVTAAARLHKLQGGAGNLAATAVATAARELEVAIKQGRDAQIAAGLSTLGQELARLLQSARPWFEQPAPSSSTPEAPAIDDDALQRLMSALAAQNLDALELCESLQPGIRARFGSDPADAIAEAVRNLRFDDALATLNELRETA
jgi:signal transduction histidine kinase/CheY-like chemotaxis protein/HPt (histidine-containing phosphotransfer) domain-containing protein